MLCIKCTHTHSSEFIASRLTHVHRFACRRASPPRPQTIQFFSLTSWDHHSLQLPFLFRSAAMSESFPTPRSATTSIPRPSEGRKEIFIYNLIYIRNEFSVRNAVDWWQFHGITLLIIGTLHSTAV